MWAGIYNPTSSSSPSIPHTHTHTPTHPSPPPQGHLASLAACRKLDAAAAGDAIARLPPLQLLQPAKVLAQQVGVKGCVGCGWDVGKAAMGENWLGCG